MHLIEQVSQRAHYISSLLERELERTLIDDPSDDDEEGNKGNGGNESWVDLCAQNNPHYENISEDEEAGNSDSKSSHSQNIRYE